MPRRQKEIGFPFFWEGRRPKGRRRSEGEKEESLRAQEFPEPQSSEEDSLFLSDPREAVREVLETIAKMPSPGIGLRTVAGILRGETRANWLSYIARTESWGAFLPNSLPTVEAFLRELLRAGYIEGIHFTRITEHGQKILEGEGPPMVRRRVKVIAPKFRPLLWKLLLLRARLVNERKAPGLLKDAALLSILKAMPTSVEDLKTLKGIGPFVVNYLGERIVRIIKEFKESDQRKEEQTVSPRGKETAPPKGPKT